MRSRFSDFLNKKNRDDIKHLGILEKVLQSKGMKTENHLDDDDPYIFCYNPTKNCSFDGVRLYIIAENVAFRIQKHSDTHPYGRAYQLKIEEMFEDYLSDDGVNKKDAGMKVMEEIVTAIRKFFDTSSIIEKDIRIGDLNAGSVDLQSNDYNNQIFNGGSNSRIS